MVIIIILVIIVIQINKTSVVNYERQQFLLYREYQIPFLLAEGFEEWVLLIQLHQISLSFHQRLKHT